jgi:hypothetical protein
LGGGELLGAVNNALHLYSGYAPFESGRFYGHRCFNVFPQAVQANIKIYIETRFLRVTSNLCLTIHVVSILLKAAITSAIEALSLK